jgi:hypothetical protein
LIIGSGIAVAIVAAITLLVIVFSEADSKNQPVAFFPEQSAASAIARAQPGEHWIDVDRSTAQVTLYIGTDAQTVYSSKIGEDPSTDGFYATALGTFHVYSMIPNLAPTSFYDGGYLTDWVGFDPDRFNGFHSPVRDATGEPFPRQNDFTKGCVRLTEEDARAVFAFAELGMRIEVHE